jgi:hypothetical protein
MLPPDYGRIARLSSYFHALIETMAIAFLGTLAAGLVALPLGLLAARNVLPVWIFRFSIRRGLGSVGSVDTFIRTLIWIKCCRARSLRRRIGNMMSDVDAFGKLCPEAIETADPKAGRGDHGTRRRSPAGAGALRTDTAGPPRHGQSGSLLFRVETRAWRPSLASQEASACTCRRRFAPWNGSKSLSSFR